MKVVDLLEADEKKIKPPKPRPKKTLWFDSYENWVSDVKFSYPDAEAHKTDDEQIIALNAEEDKCYGKWDPVDQKGVTFNKPRTINSVITKRTRTEKVLNTTDVIRKSAHQ